jgi:hypothetical protein
MSAPRNRRAVVPQSSVLSSTLYNLYINDTPQTISVNLALLLYDTRLFEAKRKEGCVLSKLQQGLDSMMA